MSFIRDYLTYASANEAPMMFHVWGAYICLAATIERRVWFIADDGYLYPHLYVIYVGKAGNGKGVAMGKVKRVLIELGDIFLSGNVETPEGFIRYLCGEPNRKPTPLVSPVTKTIAGPNGQLIDTTPITIFATEFVNFIARSPEGWINLLNDIWDADPDYYYRTKNQGDDRVKGPAINVIGALTNTVAANLQKQQIIGTGLGRRTIFQFGERDWNNPHPRRILTPERAAAKDRAIAQLKSIRKRKGLLKNDQAADEFWDEWYTQNLKETPFRPLSVQSWYASKSDILIKLAMLTALSEDSTIIDISHYTIALQYLSLMEEDLHRIFGGAGRNELADVANAMYDYLALQKEPISLKEFKGQFFAMCKPPNEFNDCLDHLSQADRIVRQFVTVGKVSGEILAIPQVMKAFLDAHPEAVRLGVSTPIVLPEGSVGAARPPFPLPAPPVGWNFSLPTSQARIDGIADDQLHSNSEQD